MAGRTEVVAMRRALELARLGTRSARPNPPVGAVVLDPAGQVAGEGWHRRAGGPHAEVVALTEAGRRAAGGTLVVTLEPCNTVGRTGRCVDAVRAAKVARVVYAVPDPTSAAGGGAALRAAGLDVESGALAAEAEAVAAAWLTWSRLGRPYVVWKVASTLDGRVAAADGTSRWISSAESRADAHRLRAECDAVVAGVGTVAADDPQLTVRDADGRPSGAQPLRVVVDSAGRTPAGARVRDGEAPTWVATVDEVGAGPDGRVDLVALLQALAGRGVQQVLLEGGPTLAGAFLRAGLVDRLVAYLSPLLLGDGPPALTGTGIATLADAARLQVEDVRVLGPDVRLTAGPRREGT